jgi:hypothetical protein
MIIYKNQFSLDFFLINNKFFIHEKFIGGFLFLFYKNKKIAFEFPDNKPQLIFFIFFSNKEIAFSFADKLHQSILSLFCSNK